MTEKASPRLLVFLLCAVLSGCGKPTFLAPKPKRFPIEELKAAAGQRHLYWEIWCISWSRDPEKQFQANLCERDCHGITNDDVPPGTKWWAQEGATQEQAAANLLDSPWSYVTSARRMPEEIKKQCPPELSGGPR